MAMTIHAQAKSIFNLAFYMCRLAGLAFMFRLAFCFRSYSSIHTDTYSMLLLWWWFHSIFD